MKYAWLICCLAFHSLCAVGEASTVEPESKATVPVAQSVSKPDDEKRLSRQARLHEDRNELGEALRIHQELSKAEPRSTGNAHVLLAAQLMLKEGKKKQAIAYVEKNLTGETLLDIAMRTLFFRNAGMHEDEEKGHLKMVVFFQHPAAKAICRIDAAEAALKAGARERCAKYLAEAQGTQHPVLKVRERAKNLQDRLNELQTNK